MKKIDVLSKNPFDRTLTRNFCPIPKEQRLSHSSESTFMWTSKESKEVYMEGLGGGKQSGKLRYYI